MKRFLIWGIAFLVVVGLIGVIFGDDEVAEESKSVKMSEEADTDEKEVKSDAEPEEESKAEAKVEEEESESYVASGENGVFKDDAMMGIESKENLDELIRYASKNNKEAMQEMILSGKAMFIPKGTEFTMVDAGIITDKIRVDGVEGYIPVEFTRQ